MNSSDFRWRLFFLPMFGCCWCVFSFSFVREFEKPLCYWLQPTPLSVLESIPLLEHMMDSKHCWFLPTAAASDLSRQVRNLVQDANPHVQCSTKPWVVSLPLCWAFITFIKSYHLWTALGYFVRLHIDKWLVFRLLKSVVCSLFTSFCWLNLLQKWAVAWMLLWPSRGAMHLGQVQPCSPPSRRNHQLLVQWWPSRMEELSQDLLPGGSQPKQGLQLHSSQSTWFGHRPFPEIKEKWNTLSFWYCLWESRFPMLNARDVGHTHQGCKRCSSNTRTEEKGTLEAFS